MSKEIQVLKQTELLGHQFTVYGTAEEPLFRAKDVAEFIEHKNITHLLALVDDDEKGVTEYVTPGGNQEVWMLTEDGLYEVLMQSRKPIAKQFKKGVKAILKEIRTKGGYMVAREDESPEEIMSRALIIAQETIERKNKQISELNEAVSEKDQQLCDKDQQIKEKQQEIIEKTPGYNFSKAVEMGLFEIKKTVITASDGSQIIKNTTKVTPKGQIYFVNKFINNNNIFTQIKKEA